MESKSELEQDEGVSPRKNERRARRSSVPYPLY
jgi:hypothetical protein